VIQSCPPLSRDQKREAVGMMKQQVVLMAAVLSLLIGTSTCMPAAAGSGRSMLQQARDCLLFAAAVDIDHLHICACSACSCGHQ